MIQIEITAKELFLLVVGYHFLKPFIEGFSLAVVQRITKKIRRSRIKKEMKRGLCRAPQKKGDFRVWQRPGGMSH